jgi:phosphatidylserine/phosphatidylglycerophosphate/cardiolipin synthase-like enzyme
MVGWRDKKAADWVYDWVTKIVATGSTKETFASKDRQLELSPSLRILLDAGKPKQSIIYDCALQLIDEAQESIFFTCQYFPGGRTGKHLLKAYDRGVDVRIVYSHPLAHGPKAPAHWLYNTRERLRLPAALFSEQRAAKAPTVHAKVIATEKGAIVGSHNYVPQGVWLGTAEIALLSNDPEFSKALVRKIGSEL